MTTYIVYTNEAIEALGDSADAAWAELLATREPGFTIVDPGEEAPTDGRNWCHSTDFRIATATDALAARVREQGGDIAWRWIRGVACTVEEYDNQPLGSEAP